VLTKRTANLSADRAVAATRQLGDLRRRGALALEAEFLSFLLVLSHAEIFTEGADSDHRRIV
jgi:hypothetical protein